MKYGIYIVDGNYSRKELWCYLSTQYFQTPSFHGMGRHKHADKSELVLNFKKHNAKFLTDDRKTIKFLFFDNFGSKVVYPLVEERINISTITGSQLKSLCKRANKFNWLEFRDYGLSRNHVSGWQLSVFELIDNANVLHGGRSLYDNLFAD